MVPLRRRKARLLSFHPGLAKLLVPSGRRYYVNTATNGESCSGQHPTAAPGVLSIWRGTSLLHFLGFRAFPSETSSEAARRFSFPQDWSGRRVEQGGEGCPSRLGSSLKPASLWNPTSWSGTVFSKLGSCNGHGPQLGLNQI